MKKRLLYIMMLLACVAMPLTSCDNDEPGNDAQEGQHDPASDSDQTAVTGYDGLEYMQSCIVVVDYNDEIVRRIYGKPLDASQPTVVSVPVSDLAMAQNIFLTWVAPGKEVALVEHGYDYTLTDDKGNEQGSVSFRAVDNEAGVIARMTVAEGTALKQVSAVKFVSADIWPENDEIAKYETGKTYMFNDDVWEWVPYSRKNFGSGGTLTTAECLKQKLEYYCIQGNDNGKEAVLVWLCPDEDSTRKHPRPAKYIENNSMFIDYPVYTKLPSVSDAQKVLNIYNANYDAWQAMLKTMDAKGHIWSAKLGLDTTGNSEFLLNSYDANSNKIKCLDLDGKTGEICNVWGSSLFRYRYCHIRIYPPYIAE